MAVRPIDASHFGEIMEQWKKDCLECDDQHGADVIADVILQLDDIPTLTPPNEPMTLEQLREMEGQWIIIKAFDADISGIMPAFIKDQFATTLCELGSKAIVPDLCEAHFSFNEYGKTWIAYRRPPEGEA